jgi:hypothetical protein
MFALLLSILISNCLVLASSVAETLPLNVQEEDEAFDRALIASLEADVIPRVGAARVSDDVLSHLGRVLQEGSRLHDFEVSTPSNHSWELDPEPKKDRDLSVGTTLAGTVVPREKFPYWCFNLFFQICSDTVKGAKNNLRTRQMPHSFNCRSRELPKTCRSACLTCVAHPLPSHARQLCSRSVSPGQSAVSQVRKIVNSHNDRVFMTTKI